MATIGYLFKADHERSYTIELSPQENTTLIMSFLGCDESIHLEPYEVSELIKLLQKIEADKADIMIEHFKNSCHV